MFRIKQLKSEHPYPTTVPAKQYIGQTPTGQMGDVQD